MNNIIFWGIIELLFFGAAIVISIFIHELGHLIAALLVGVEVKGFSVGFGRPIIWKKKWKGITWQITPWMVGGWTALEGETDKKNKKGFLAQRWSKKAFILIAGVAMNFLLACILYMIMYKSILVGIKIDFAIITSLFTRDFVPLYNLLEGVKFHPFLIQLSFINLFCCLNLLPLYPMDGGIIVFEPLIEKYFDKYRELIQRIGMISLWILQILLIAYIWFK